MKSSLSHEIKVGIFVFIGIVLFCLSVLLLGGDKKFLTSKYYLRVQLPQVQGIGRGSVVTLSGYPIGNVEDISFIPGSHLVEVRFNVELAVQPRITKGSIASIKTQGALGDKYIFIVPGPLDAPPLQNNDLVELDKSPDFIDVIASKGAEMGQVVDLIKEVRILVNNLNGNGKSAQLMSSLVESSDQLNKVLGESRSLLTPMASIMKKIDNGQGTLGALVNDPTLHQRLTRFLGETPRNRFLKPLIRDSIQTSEGK